MSVQRARAHLTSARRIESNRARGLYNGRNASAQDAHLTDLYGRAALELRGTPRHLVGAVWAEHDLAGRLAAARRLEQDRPELRERLAAVRRELREEVTA